jgi:single-strand DNA-binding protein
MSLAKVNGLFRLTRDAELVYTQGGSAITKLGLACSEKYKDKETQLFLDAVAFGKLGELISQYADSKGTQIYLSGKLQTETWQDKQSGQNRSKVSMVIESMDFVSGQSNNSQTNQAPQQGQYQQQPQSYQQPQQANQPPVYYENAQGQPTPPPQPQQPPEIDVDSESVPF